MLTVRDARPQDAAACAAVYAPYVTRTAISFEATAPDADAIAARIAAAQRRHAWLVAERDGEVAGYASAGPFRERPAYDWACETSIYLRIGLRRTGAGRALLSALLDRVEERGSRRAIAAIALPNAASVGLHEALGYRPAGRVERVGWKLGAWHDVLWLQKDLGPVDDPPSDPPSA